MCRKKTGRGGLRPWRDLSICMNQNTFRVGRNEYKYILTPGEALSLKRRLETLLERDSHSGPDGYTVRSLYFDALDNRDFHRKLAGVQTRKKIRLRVYSPDDTEVKLEAKRKDGDAQTKLTLLISREAARRVTDGDFSALTGCFGGTDQQNMTAVYFYTVMTLGCYRPVTMVEYNRTAFTFPAGDVRITFDENVRATEADCDLFRADPLYVPVTDGRCILEVKYTGKMVGFISDALKPYHLTRLAVSKYCMSRPVFYSWL